MEFSRTRIERLVQCPLPPATPVFGVVCGRYASSALPFITVIELGPSILIDGTINLLGIISESFFLFPCLSFFHIYIHVQSITYQRTMIDLLTGIYIPRNDTSAIPKCVPRFTAQPLRHLLSHDSPCQLAAAMDRSLVNRQRSGGAINAPVI